MDKPLKRPTPVNEIKALYVEGYGSVHISRATGTPRDTVSWHIAKNKKSWQKLRKARELENERIEVDIEQLDARERQVLDLLFAEIERRMDEIVEMKNDDALNEMERYLSLYQKFKTPKSQTRKDKLIGATEAVRIIARLAENESDEVKIWFAKNASRILDEIGSIRK